MGADQSGEVKDREQKEGGPSAGVCMDKEMKRGDCARVTMVSCLV
jgi:hypothetical protein